MSVPFPRHECRQLRVRLTGLRDNRLFLSERIVPCGGPLRLGSKITFVCIGASTPSSLRLYVVASSRHRMPTYHRTDPPQKEEMKLILVETGVR